MAMRTLIEASAAFDQGAGIGRYSRNIISRLLALPGEQSWTLMRAPEERGNDPGFFSPPRRSGMRMVTLPINRRNADRMWHRLGLPVDARLFGGRADVVYSPDFTAPPVARVPRMITVHDLAFLTHPQTTTEALRRYLEWVVPRQVERADLVAVVSEATKYAVMEHLGVPEAKIVLARNAVDQRFREATALRAEDRERLGVPDRYMLMLGTIEPRKNHLTALRALEASGVGEHVPLVLAGRPGWGHEDAVALAGRLQDRGLVRMLSYVPESDLPGLIAGATAMLYPSWTEGFGLPVAEALATGIPVITGTAPALREVGGPFARYAHPADVDAIAAHIRDVVARGSTDDERRVRREWTDQFSWDSSTASVFDSLCRLVR